MKKIISLVVLLITLLLGMSSVSAGIDDTRLVKYRYDNIFAVYDGPDRVHVFFGQRYLMNDITAYCIEPGVAIDTDLYSSSPDYSMSDFNSDTINYIKLVAYFGYDYPGHENVRYFMAAQEMIWEKVSGRSTRWVSEQSVNGPEINIDAEKNEIMRLINEHNTSPSFNDQVIEVNLGENKTITDINDVLFDYEIYNTNLDDASISGNNLSLKVNDLNKDYYINFIRKGYSSRIALLYYSGNNQKLASSGMLDPMMATLKIKALGGKIKVNKVDSETNANAQGNATLQGAKYGIYNSDGTLIDTLITGSSDTSKELPFGTYTIKELEASKGYQLDNSSYEVVLDKNNIDSDNILLKTVKENVIKRNVELHKVYASDKSEILKGEPNAIFDIYLKSSNNKYISVTTDSEGYARTTLPYGVYVIKQVAGTPNYEMVEAFEIEVKEVGSDIRLVLSDAEKKAKLKVIKVDKETGEVIERSGIKFKIFDVDENKYVCQTITYPESKTICEYETDERGIFITPNPLSHGTYRLEEVDQVIDGYLWNNFSKVFKIDENSNLIVDNEYGIIFETKFENERVKGCIELTKKGEEIIINDGKYSYSEINLSGVKFNLYDENNNLVSEFTTDENGNIKVENLELGKYILKEVSTIKNHVLDDTAYGMELKYIDQYTPVVVVSKIIKNYLPKGTLEFSKVDYSTSEALPYTIIEIYTENDELIYSGVTDENGQIIINDLSIGKYYILEKEAPIGYTLNPEKMEFEIKEDGEVVRAEMKDEMIVEKVEVPSTKQDKSLSLHFIVTGFIIIGFGLIIYDKKDKK